MAENRMGLREIEGDRWVVRKMEGERGERDVVALESKIEGDEWVL